jgi:hypothetical protein
VLSFERRNQHLRTRQVSTPPIFPWENAVHILVGKSCGIIIHADAGICNIRYVFGKSEVLLCMVQYFRYHTYRSMVLGCVCRPLLHTSITYQ